MGLNCQVSRVSTRFFASLPKTFWAPACLEATLLSPKLHGLFADFTGLGGSSESLFRLCRGLRPAGLLSATSHPVIFLAQPSMLLSRLEFI